MYILVPGIQVYTRSKLSRVSRCCRRDCPATWGGAQAVLVGVREPGGRGQADGNISAVGRGRSGAVSDVPSVHFGLHLSKM